jgi:RNA polymerase sigma-70 factor (ECF subfamily)
MIVATIARHSLGAGLSAPPARPSPPDEVSVDPVTLVAAHLAGDTQAFGTLVKLYQTRLLTFVFRMVGDRERAEDLVQEAFIRVHRHLDRFDPSKKFSTWIYTIAANLAKNELRNRRRNPLVLFQMLRQRWNGTDPSPLDFEDERGRPDRVFAREHLHQLVDRMVGRLSDHHREVFILRELEGRSYDEIAEIVHCNLGTVKSRLNRARETFAQLIAPHLE